MSNEPFDSKVMWHKNKLWFDMWTAELAKVLMVYQDEALS